MYMYRSIRPYKYIWEPHCNWCRHVYRELNTEADALATKRLTDKFTETQVSPTRRHASPHARGLLMLVAVVSVKGLDGFSWAAGQKRRTTGRKLPRAALFYGRLVRQQDDNPMRKLALCTGSRRPATDEYVRRVGRPRNERVKMVQREAQKIAPNNQASQWATHVNKHFA